MRRLEKTIKNPAYGGQKRREYVPCTSCEGTRVTQQGSCDRGCCAPFTPKVCYRCDGERAITHYYRAKLAWVEYFPKKKQTRKVSAK